MLRVKDVLDLCATLATIVACVVLVSVAYGGRDRQYASPSRVTSDEGAVADLSRQPPSLTLPALKTGLYDEGGLAIVEFSDFQCPYCKMYATKTLERVKQTFVDSGRLQYIFVHFPLEAIHPFALRASVAAECARDQGKFWEMHKALFESQADLGEAMFGALARKVGLDASQFDECLKTSSSSAIRDGISAGEGIGVDSTPSFALGRVEGGKLTVLKLIRGAVPYEALERELNSLSARES